VARCHPRGSCIASDHAPSGERLTAAGAVCRCRSILEEYRVASPPCLGKWEVISDDTHAEDEDVTLTRTGTASPDAASKLAARAEWPSGDGLAVELPTHGREVPKRAKQDAWPVLRLEELCIGLWPALVFILSRSTVPGCQLFLGALPVVSLRDSFGASPMKLADRWISLEDRHPQFRGIVDLLLLPSLHAFRKRGHNSSFNDPLITLTSDYDARLTWVD
jgi:hypothetical protein